MNIDIRKHIKNNFKKADIDEFKTSIDESIKQKEEVTLPGLGVFFEILWINSDESKKEYILNTLKELIINHLILISIIYHFIFLYIIRRFLFGKTLSHYNGKEYTASASDMLTDAVISDLSSIRFYANI